VNPFLMIFIDGVGIGKEDAVNNPFFRYGFKTFRELFGGIPSEENHTLIKDGRYLFPVDACLGIPGLPQSGTGQASIFCGINAAEYVGKHFGPYPYSTLIPVIKEKNIFIELINRDKKVTFVNAYPSVFFDYIRSGKTRLSVTSLSCRLSGMRLNNATDVRRGNALTAEITNERWNKKLGYDLKIIRPETAARRLIRIAGRNDFTLYEYFLTDHIGHGRYEESTEATLQTLDRFLYTVISALPNNMDLFICSDHGNVEDLSIKSHTINPALAISAGKNANQFYKKVKDLAGIKQVILDVAG
jgi:2,3-bisphosphoglycerate-independent phosphoglycerate mutase